METAISINSKWFVKQQNNSVNKDKIKKLPDLWTAKIPKNSLIYKQEGYQRAARSKNSKDIKEQQDL